MYIMKGGTEVYFHGNESINEVDFPEYMAMVTHM